jgi:hypothetical protein
MEKSGARSKSVLECLAPSPWRAERAMIFRLKLSDQIDATSKNKGAHSTIQPSKTMT